MVQFVFMNTQLRNISIFTIVVLGLIISLNKSTSIFKTSQPISPSLLQTPTPTPVPSLIGWMSYWDEQASYTRLKEIMGQLSIFSPMLYRIGIAGELIPYTITTRNQVLALARAKKIPILPTIGDDSRAALIQELLYDQDAQQSFAENLILEAKNQSYVGWALDIEVVTENDTEAFSTFVERLATKLHAEKLLLHVIVYAKEANETYKPALAHDYFRLGKAADRIILMTYGYNNELTDSGGQTPVHWLRDVLRYAVSSVPKEKLTVGLSTHGYLWTGDQVEGLTYNQASRLISEKDLMPVYNEKEGAMRASFTQKNEDAILFYETADTIVKKISLVQSEYDIHSFALWRTGAEDSTAWNLLAPTPVLQVSTASASATETQAE